MTEPNPAQVTLHCGSESTRDMARKERGGAARIRTRSGVMASRGPACHLTRSSVITNSTHCLASSTLFPAQPTSAEANGTCSFVCAMNNSGSKQAARCNAYRLAQRTTADISRGNRSCGVPPRDHSSHAANAAPMTARLPLANALGRSASGLRTSAWRSRSRHRQARHDPPRSVASASTPLYTCPASRGIRRTSQQKERPSPRNAMARSTQNVVQERSPDQLPFLSCTARHISATFEAVGGSNKTPADSATVHSMSMRST